MEIGRDNYQVATVQLESGPSRGSLFTTGHATSALHALVSRCTCRVEDWKACLHACVNSLTPTRTCARTHSPQKLRITLQKMLVDVFDLLPDVLSTSCAQCRHCAPMVVATHCPCVARKIFQYAIEEVSLNVGHDLFLSGETGDSLYFMRGSLNYHSRFDAQEVHSVLSRTNRNATSTLQNLNGHWSVPHFFFLWCLKPVLMACGCTVVGSFTN
eukprot:3213517-Amphidinium_carterae.1